MKKALALILMICFMLNALPAFANEDFPTVTGTPNIRLSSTSTVEVVQGRTEEILLDIKNVGSATAYNLFVQATPQPTDPFILSAEIVGGSATLQAGASKQVKLTINVDKGAPQGVYPLSLNFSCVNEAKSTFDSTDNLNIKVNNPFTASNIRIYDFVLEPETMTPGETADLSFHYMNMGSAVEEYLKIALEGLDPAAITVPQGPNSQTFTGVKVYSVESCSFKIKANKDMKSGSYPIKITTTVRAQDGSYVTQEQTYYVSVSASGTAEEGDAVLEVAAMVAPTQTFGVGQAFTIAFDVKNTSKYNANNVIVKANAVEGNVIVPTSQSIIQTRQLNAGESKKHSFTFAATSAAKSQNYPISFDIEYDSAERNDEITKIKFSQFFGVNISNPEEDKEEEDDDESAKNVPKIIISSYSCEPNIVKAGSQFTLSMEFLNSHAQKTVKNIKVSLTVTDKDDKLGASIFSPVNASNTLYIDEIAPKSTVSRSIEYYAIPDAQPQNYSINVNFEYEDAEGKQITAQEIVGINVSQPPSVETSEMMVPEFAQLGMPVYVNFDIFNTGKVVVNNLKVTVEGDVPVDNKTTFIGNLEPGSQEPFEMQIFPEMPGELTGTIVVSYDSTTGEHFEIPKEFSMQIDEPPPMDPGMFEQDMPMENDSSNKGLMIAIGVAVAAALAAGGFFGYKLYLKKKKGNDFYE